MVNGIEYYEFQENCVDYLIDRTTDPTSKQIITVKAPTGAGKTVMLIQYVDNFLKNTDGQTAFIWLCPGKGNLEEQSMERMEDLKPSIDVRVLNQSLRSGFAGASVTFVNWELVTKKGNTALRDGERANLFEKIEEAHSLGIHFIIIVDEEHQNNTSKADDIIKAFKPDHIIRVSATAKKGADQEFYEIPEEEVIAAGLITSAIYVNEGVYESTKIENDYDYLLELADAKRKEMLDGYEMVKANVRPLVLIQFPAAQPETIKAVEEKLASMGYTYENGTVNIWMADAKEISDDLTANNGTPDFLLMKQAVATGWDCPRAKILVKLREGGEEDFQIQTIGRIRRMPERKHYFFPGFLDLCYIYTLDTQYKEGLLTSLDKAYQVRKLFSKEKVRDFHLTKEVRDRDYDTGISEREMLRRVYEHFTEKYHLTKDHKENMEKLRIAGYNFSPDIDSKIIQGEFRTTADIANASSSKKIEIKTKINTHSHGIYLLHTMGDIKKITAISSQKVSKILGRLFRRGKKSRGSKLLSLETNDFYAFIINNSKLLKNEFREIKASHDQSIQLQFMNAAKTETFSIPESELYKFTPVKKVRPLDKNAYDRYTNEFLASEAQKSTPERLFELYCEKVEDIDWVYKNGDHGRQYFSIVYQDGFQKQWLFYPDYIVRMTNGDIWLIETKGGEQGGYTKNIDIQVENKFGAFKSFAEKYKLKWGFVRDIDGELYIDNTVYTEDMSGDNWRPLEDILK